MCVLFCVFLFGFLSLLRRGFVGCEAQDVKERRRELYIHLECGEVVLLRLDSDDEC